MEIMKSDLGLNIMHIPYRGDAQGPAGPEGTRKWTSPYITLFSAQARIRAGEFKALGLQNDRLTAFPTSRPPSKSARRTGHAGLDRLLRPARHARRRHAQN